MTRILTATLCGGALLAGSLIAATPSTTLAQSKTVRPAIVLPPPAPPAPPVPPAAPGAPAPEATPAVPGVPAPVAAPAVLAVPQAPAPAAAPQAPRPPTPASAPEPPPAPAAPPAPPVPDSIYDANVRVDVTISYQVGTATPVKRSATLVAANDTNASSLRAGISLPVPSTTFKESDTRPLTSYNYRSVGLNVDLNSISIRRTGSIQLRGLQVEFSAIDEKTIGANPMPSFPTFSQRFYLTLSSGKPLVVAQSTDIVDGVERKQTVEVKATILPGGEDVTPRPKR